MPRKKFTPEVLGRIKQLLHLRWSHSRINENLKGLGVSISKAHLSRIRNNRPNNQKSRRQKKKPGPPPRLRGAALNRLRHMLAGENPPTQRAMALRLKVSQRTVQRALKRLGKILITKRKCHALSKNAIEKRYRRAWQLYRKLRCDRWRKFITVDEALFYLTGNEGKRRVQYISRGETRTTAAPFTVTSFPKGVMVFMGISANGFTPPIFVEPGVKINANYYVGNVLKKFLRQAKKLYPTGDWIFHQDSAPAHTAKQTIEFLEANGVNFVKPSEWLPNSPDVAPCDYFWWGTLKYRLRRRRIRTLGGLKKAICQEVKKIPQWQIDRALKSWPKRLRMIYYNKGSHIEHQM